MLADYVAETVIPLASATIWVRPEILNIETDKEVIDIINQYVNKMQILQITQGYSRIGVLGTGEPPEKAMSIVLDDSGKVIGLRTCNGVGGILGNPNTLEPLDSIEDEMDGLEAFMLAHTKTDWKDIIIGNLQSGLRSTARGKLVSRIVKDILYKCSDTVIDSVTSGLTLLLGAAVKSAEDYYKNIELVETIFQYTNMAKFASRVRRLGGEICYSIVDNKVLIHYINLNTPEFISKIDGFTRYINSLSDLSSLGIDSTQEITAEYLVKCILDPGNDTLIYEEFKKYYQRDESEYQTYLNALNKYRIKHEKEILKEFGDIYSSEKLRREVDHLPVEVLEYIIKEVHGDINK
jgi:hypothetical protein